MASTNVPFETVRNYLASYFLSEEDLLAELNLTREDLRARQSAGLLPLPSYVLTHAVISNHVFGRFLFTDERGLACDGQPGVWRYYPRTYGNWIEEFVAAGVQDRDDARA
jgi:hypothetical protein